jgi:hypothetical protein
VPGCRFALRILRALDSRPRSFFVSPRRRLPSASLSFVLRERFAFCRRDFDNAANRSCFLSAFHRSNSSSNRISANCRFALCDRESLVATRNPSADAKSPPPSKPC